MNEAKLYFVSGSLDSAGAVKVINADGSNETVAECILNLSELSILNVCEKLLKLGVITQQFPPRFY